MLLTPIKRAACAMAACAALAGTALASPLMVDFDAALRGLNFDPTTADGNLDASAAGNGLLDAAEMALIAAVLADSSIDLGADGARHADVRAAYDQALASATKDLAALSARYPTAPIAVTGYVMVGTQGSFDAIAGMCAAFGCPLEGDYQLALKLGGIFGPDGDADGDGFTNKQEYDTTIAGGTPAYVAAALDPATTPETHTILGVFWCPMRGNPCALADFAAVGPCPDCGMALITKVSFEERAVARKAAMNRVGVVLYPGFEVLDVYGPVEMWGYVTEFELLTVAEISGPVKSAQGLATVAEYSFEDCPPLDILFVPGGIGTRPALENPAMLEFLKTQHARVTHTVSVCSGSALLARAGILDGRKATSNKLFFDFAVAQSDQVEWIPKARWVEDGNIVTSSGVSAGIDMALHLVRMLYGDARARQIAAGAEYVWNDDASNDPFALVGE